MTMLSRTTRLLVPAAAAAFLTLSGTGFASATEPVTQDAPTSTQVELDPLTYLRPGNGFTNAVPDAEGVRQPAMSYVLDANGSEVNAFCVDFTQRIDEKAKFVPTAWTDSGIDTFAKVADIAARHLEIGTPLPDPRREDLATQVAIWKLTDNVRTDSTGQDDVTKRARELVSSAANAVAPSWDLQVAPKVDVSGSGADTVFTVDAEVKLDGQPVVGSAVTFTVGERNLVEVSDGEGVATVQLPARFAGEEVLVSVSTIVPAGVFLEATKGQSLVTASSTPVTVKGSTTLAEVEVQPTPEESPSPSESVEPTPTATPKPNQPNEPKGEKDTKPSALPTTGSDTNPLPFVVLLVLAAAGFAGFAATRRR